MCGWMTKKSRRLSLTISVLHLVTYLVTLFLQEKLQLQQKWVSSSVTGTRWVVFTVVFTT